MFYRETKRSSYCCVVSLFDVLSVLVNADFFNLKDSGYGFLFPDFNIFFSLEE